ncbi:hypothetical protein FQR65_LT16421 [Abscondita terminalis]|nr:hypothetical protein FQR65_LT16421 [Abscondita terminalis]
MKTELKKKADKTATGNKKIVLNAWEKQLLAPMEENPVFQKITRNNMYDFDTLSSTYVKCYWNKTKSQAIYHPRPLRSIDCVEVREPLKTLSETENKEVTEAFITILPECTIAQHIMKCKGGGSHRDCERRRRPETETGDRDQYLSYSFVLALVPACDRDRRLRREIEDNETVAIPD